MMDFISEKYQLDIKNKKNFSTLNRIEHPFCEEKNIKLICKIEGKGLSRSELIKGPNLFWDKQKKKENKKIFNATDHSDIVFKKTIQRFICTRI